MSFQPTLLEDTLDPWLAAEPDARRREAVLRFLMTLCDAEGVQRDAVAISGTQLPAYTAAVDGAGVVIVWVIAIDHRQLAIRYLYDTLTGARHGG